MKQHEETIRRLYAAFSAGDMETFATLVTPDLVWSVPGNSRISGDHKGLDAVFALFGLCGELTAGNLHVEPLTIKVESDTRAVSTHTVKAGRPDGRTLDVVETEVLTFENGKISRADESPSDQAASDAFWS